MSSGRLSIAATFQAFNARRAARYREHAERLREMAAEQAERFREMTASEPDDILRDQLVRIAEQYNNLATQLDAAHQPNDKQRGRPH
jgi:adenine C2-methylase RlmN of 23S rRNA A2503 and tRNA A37